ncbi:ribonuclease R family protein [Candidatus Chlamydia sanziniae]|uniref:Ribonuclease R n=1 Tax=Candidatus Chlamydia sanziniae TaxID=1806891 RepID=A0A1A9HUB1_9CHLA|nr:ribonuclease R family protein [Candidatus Chlamydia sanziniae]ANH78297.1 3'-to-5' exoribonuclease RNase R [Candidatus Chlamydia sanziniae]
MKKPKKRTGRNFKKNSSKIAISGTLFVHPKKGFGFVSPDDPEEYSFDIFVPARNLKGALDGDHVIVEVSLHSKKGEKKQGIIKQVLSRGKTTLVGTITSLLTPTTALVYSSMLGTESLLPAQLLPQHTYKIGDRILFSTPPWVDKKETTATPPLIMLEFIGNITHAEADFAAIKAEYNLDENFPEEILNEAHLFSQKQITQALHSRKDLRDLLCFTIDSATAKDFDDAISLTHDHNNYILGVHIADVSHYVTPHSFLDKEAAKRCNSTYFAGKVIPMLPPALSDNLCSLKPNIDRLAVSVFMTFTKSGHLSDYQIFRSIIRSKYRMTYDEVDQIIEKEQIHPISKTLQNMATLSKKFTCIREERGCIQFILPSFTMELDNLQEPVSLIENRQTFSHKLIEEFMLKANEVIAYHISHQGIPLPFRSHEPPKDENLLAFQELAKNMGFDIIFTPAQEPDYQYLLHTASAGHPLEQFLHSQFVRSMKTASYSTENKGHYGLKLDYYTHFTSPIRRYIDLIVHRLLFHPMSIDEHRLELIVRACSIKERISAKAESAFENLKKIRFINKFLQEQPNTVYSAYVLTVTSEGLSFIVTEFYHEGFIPAADLPKEYALKKKPSSDHLPDRMKPGAPLHVKIAHANLLTQTITWTIIPTTEEPKSKKVKKKKKTL